jgi:tripartite-type tricarboxylate transporter receptor subunit TctC
MSIRLRLMCALALALVTASIAPARAQDAIAQFYKGKELKLYIGSTPGGGYDSYSRLLARYIDKYIPGNPTIVPINMPGAGSNRLAAYIYSVAPKDGTEFALIFPGAILDPLIGTQQVQDDPSKLIYLGSANIEVFTCFVRADAPVKSYQDAMKMQVLLAASAAGGSSRDIPALENALLGTKFRVVSGYPGSREINLAIEQGEVQGACGIGLSSIEIQYPDWATSNKIRILAQEAVKGNPTLDAKGVPLTYSFAKTNEDRQIMELAYSQEVFGRPFILPPGVPPERVAALRKAFLAAFDDKELLAEAQTMRLDIAPISGAEVQALVSKVYSFPANIVEKAKQALIYKDPQ